MYKIYVYWVKINANIFMQDFKKKKKIISDKVHCQTQVWLHSTGPQVRHSEKEQYVFQLLCHFCTICVVRTGKDNFAKMFSPW